MDAIVPPWSKKLFQLFECKNEFILLVLPRFNFFAAIEKCYHFAKHNDHQPIGAAKKFKTNHSKITFFPIVI